MPTFLTPFLLFLMVLLPAPTLLRAQCNGLEIPGNGVDEDCDGLDDLFLHLPPHIYLVTGEPFELFFRHTILSNHPGDYVFTLSTPLGGQSSAEKWIITPLNKQVGIYPLVLVVRTPEGVVLDSASTMVRVSPRGNPGQFKPRKLLLLGHSFFDQGYLPFYLREMLVQNPNPTVTFHGKRQGWMGNGIRFEAIGGASWQYYASLPQSPLYYNGVLNLRQYLDEVVGPGENPDWIIIHLDINDYCAVGNLDDSSPASIDAYINTQYLLHTKPLIDSLRAVAPGMKIGLTYSPYPSASDEAFALAYGGSSMLANRFRWRLIVSRLLFKNTEFFAGREAENIYLLPAHLDLDDYNDYHVADPIHPHPQPGSLDGASGYRRIARTHYAWLRYVMTNTGLDILPDQATPWKRLESPGFQCYPNPATTQLTVEAVGAPDGLINILIFSPLGQLIRAETFRPNTSGRFELDLSGMPGGLYLLRITPADGAAVLKHLVVVDP